MIRYKGDMDLFDMVMECDIEGIRKLFEEEFGCRYLGYGCSRVVFENPLTRSVIKVPLGDLGFECNGSEEYFFRRNRDPRYARCSLEDYEGVMLLHMEYVIPYHHKTKYSQLPEWTGWIDCCQVGFTDDGRLVAYDYADSPL